MMDNLQAGILALSPAAHAPLSYAAHARHDAAQGAMRRAGSMYTVELSFDDGPGPSTPALLDVLAAAGCRATFFLLGANLARGMYVAARMLADGHVLGNHAYSHARPDALDAATLRDELTATDHLIQQLHRDAGRAVPPVIPVRLPYGLISGDPRAAVLRALGRCHVGWTHLADDWREPAPSPSSLVDALRRHIDTQQARRRSALICLHDASRRGAHRPATVAAVELLLATPRYRTLLGAS